jgi:hypothetical protein
MVKALFSLLIFSIALAFSDHSFAENAAMSPLYMDRGDALGNSQDIDSRRALHVKIKNTSGEPISVGSITPAALPVNQKAITVGTTATRATISGAAPHAARVLLAIQPDSASSAKFWLGSSTVANVGANQGLPIMPGQTIVFNNDAGDYYLISDTVGQTVYVLEQQ